MVIYIILIGIVFLIILFVIFYLVSHIISFAYGAPYVDSSLKISDEIIDFLDLKKEDIFYDLGCGSGFILSLVAERKVKKAIGVELSPMAYLMSKIITFKFKNAQVIYSDFNKIDLSKATVIYCYLFPKPAQKLHVKFAKELKKGTRVICQDFPLKDKKPSLTKKIGRHTLYEFVY